MSTDNKPTTEFLLSSSIPAIKAKLAAIGGEVKWMHLHADCSCEVKRGTVNSMEYSVLPTRAEHQPIADASADKRHHRLTTIERGRMLTFILLFEFTSHVALDKRRFACDGNVVPQCVPLHMHHRHMTKNHAVCCMPRTETDRRAVDQQLSVVNDA